MKPTSTFQSPTSPDPFDGALRRYLNRNYQPGNGAGKWLFGALPDNFSPDGLEWVWTEKENQALSDHGEVAAMLGLGTGQAVSATMTSDKGTSGASATHWDSILEQIAGGTHSSQLMCRRTNKRKGGKFDAIRNDGARVELISCF